jgi:hypothetical protein
LCVVFFFLFIPLMAFSPLATSLSLSLSLSFSNSNECSFIHSFLTHFCTHTMGHWCLCFLKAYFLSLLPFNNNPFSQYVLNSLFLSRSTAHRKSNKSFFLFKMTLTGKKGILLLCVEIFSLLFFTLFHFAIIFHLFKLLLAL